MDIQFPVIIAYNMAEKKIGCVLTQAAMGATISGGQVSFHFSPEFWELNPTKCSLYSINSQEEFDLMVNITKENVKL